jgi:hypothetical protein
VVRDGEARGDLVLQIIMVATKDLLGADTKPQQA